MYTYDSLFDADFAAKNEVAREIRSHMTLQHCLLLHAIAGEEE